MTRVTILHTNDLHGRVHQLARIGGLVRKIRHEVEQAGGTCFYFDCGDCEDTILLESSLTKGASMDAILSAAGCDEVALGNAIPIRYGYQAIANLAASFGKPILCANLYTDKGSHIKGTEPYTIVEAQGLRIGLIGVSDPMNVYQSIFHMQTFRPAEVLPGWIDTVKRQDANTVVLLSHLSSGVDLELPKEVEEIDLILGGHDHQILYPPREVEGCIIAQAGQYGKHLGRFDLDIDPETGKIVHYQATLIEVGEDLPEDEQVLLAVKHEQERVEAMMHVILGQVSHPLKLLADQECAAGDLLADALLERFPQAECAIVLAGHWLTGLPAGEISLGALFAANRSTANPALAKLTGEQIYSLLKKALKPENAVRTIDRQLRGGFVGMPHVAGLSLHWDGKSVESLKIFLGGMPLQPNQIYRVAATDMEFSDFVGYIAIVNKYCQYEVPTVIPEVLQDYITRHSPIQIISDHRLVVDL